MQRNEALQGYRAWTLTLPLRTVSELNKHEHWRVTHKRRDQQKHEVYYALRVGIGNRVVNGFPPASARVTLTRIAPRTLDSDNLAASFKAVRDAVAAYLLIDDGDGRLIWVYKQERGNPKEYMVRITLEVCGE